MINPGPAQVPKISLSVPVVMLALAHSRVQR
jgi:hypothetical protein